RTPFPYGGPRESFNVSRFRSDQEASIRHMNYSVEELLDILGASLLRNQVNLYSFRGVASEDDYESVADRWVEVSVVYDLVIAEQNNPTNHSADSVDPATYTELVEALIESREIQVIMNRAQGN